MNVDAKLLALYDKLQKQIEAVETIRGDQGPQGEPGIQGPKGEQGDVGPEGRQGADGRDAVDGKDGKDGKDGVDGVSVVDAQIDIDRHLVLTLSNGEEIDAGELESLSAEAQTTYAAIHNAIDVVKTYTWADYAAGFKEVPTFVETVAEGDVYLYTYESLSLYRLVGTTEDSFYKNFSSPVLSDLVVSRGLPI